MQKNVIQAHNRDDVKTAMEITRSPATAHNMDTCDPLGQTDISSSSGDKQPDRSIPVTPSTAEVPVPRSAIGAEELLRSELLDAEQQIARMRLEMQNLNDANMHVAKLAFASAADPSSSGLLLV